MKLSLTFLVLASIVSGCALTLRATEKIDVTYVDGKHESGELIDQNVDKITLRVLMSGNQLDLPIPWTKIQSLSNGLTRDKVLKKWKDDNKDKLCPDCNGDRKIACKACGGSGLLARATQPCPACAHLDVPPAPHRLTHHQLVADALPLVLVVHLGRAARSGWPARLHLAE